MIHVNAILFNFARTYIRMIHINAILSWFARTYIRMIHVNAILLICESHRISTCSGGDTLSSRLPCLE